MDYRLLKTSFLDFELKNPLVVGSSDVTSMLDRLKLAERYGAGMVITKTASPESSPQKAFKPRFWLDRHHETILVNAGQSQSLEHMLTVVQKAKKETGLVVAASIRGDDQDLESWAKLATQMQDAGADAIELNCQKGRGIRTGWEPSKAQEITRTVKKSISIPTIVKLNPTGVDVLDSARRSVQGGADAISLVNLIQGAPELDVHRGGRLRHPGLESSFLHGLGGSPIRPIANACVARIASEIDVPIIGGGGLMKWKHCIEMLMYGAHLVQLCTAIMLYGFEILEKINKEMVQFMADHAYNSIEDFRGAGLKYTLLADTVKYIPVIAQVDVEKCNGCGLCVVGKYCDAILLDAGKAVVQESSCTGCGGCFSICPVNAVIMKQIP